MANTEWEAYTPYALVGAMVFGFMHVADELAGNWDAGAPGQSLGDPTTASIALGGMTLVGMVGLWWIVTDRGWGYLFAGVLGLQLFITGGAHVLDPAQMTEFRWGIVILEVVFAGLVLVLAAYGLLVDKPWSS